MSVRRPGRQKSRFDIFFFFQSFSIFPSGFQIIIQLYAFGNNYIGKVIDSRRIHRMTVANLTVFFLTKLSNVFITVIEMYHSISTAFYLYISFAIYKSWPQVFPIEPHTGPG